MDQFMMQYIDDFQVILDNITPDDIDHLFASTTLQTLNLLSII